MIKVPDECKLIFGSRKGKLSNRKISLQTIQRYHDEKESASWPLMEKFRPIEAPISQ